MSASNTCPSCGSVVQEDNQYSNVWICQGCGWSGDSDVVNPSDVLELEEDEEDACPCPKCGINLRENLMYSALTTSPVICTLAPDEFARLTDPATNGSALWPHIEIDDSESTTFERVYCAACHTDIAYGED
jgi:predicted RNA-binding Zn-ribbon protein involved in translation (DUF1610 family)